MPPRSTLPRFLPPLIITALAASLIAFLHFSERIESYFAAYLIPAILVATTIYLLIWFSRSSPFSSGTRRTGVLSFLALVVLAAVSLKILTRVQGVINGIGFPRLVWRWSPRVGDDLPPMDESHQTVDLSKTTPHDFPEFLGPGRHNAVVGANLSRNWSNPPRQLWRQPIGAGWSSFAIVGRWAVTEEQRGQNEMVVCYEVATGKSPWAHLHPGVRFVDSQGGDGPRATPTISGGRVYAMGATGILDCLDGATGNAVWSRNVLPDADKNLTYGKSCSPLLADNLAIVTGGRGGPSLLAYRTTDGSPAWTAGDETPGYASPILATLAGVRQIITINAASVAAHDPTTGRRLWRFAWPGSMPKNIQPIPLPGDRLLLSAGYGLGTTVLQVQSADGALSVAPVWTSRHLKPKLSNEVVYQNTVYGIDDPGVLTCLDLTTGKRLWRDGDYGFAQLLRVDDLMLIQCESGAVALIDSSPVGLRELGRFTALSSRTWSCPALAGHFLLVRNDQEAACFQLP